MYCIERSSQMWQSCFTPMPHNFDGHDFDEELRELCRRATTANDEDDLHDIAMHLRAALRTHVNRLRAMVAGHVLSDASHPKWNDPPESDTRSRNVRQPYSTRESDSASGFVTWIRPASPKIRQ